MKTNFIYGLAVLLTLLFSASGISAKDSFGPAGSSVKTGDEKYSSHNHSHDSQNTAVFSAPVSAGYFLIRCYQVMISPQDGPSCRFYPTCSAYGKEAVMRHGVLKGSFMAGERLLRCNPYNQGGDDPVPEEIFE